MNFGPQSGANWLVSRAVQRVESDASSQMARVRQAKSIEDVVRSASVSVPAEIRFMRNSIGALRSLESAAERRIDEILELQLKQISEAQSSTEAKAVRGKFIQSCSMLRGNFPGHYGRADRESKRLVSLKVQAEHRADEGASIPSTE